MARTNYVKTNLIFNVLKYFVQLVLQFVLRTVLIYTLGAQYIGLDGLFANIFKFLNLAELGVGSAIVFSMYKPIAENDVEKVKALQNLYKKFYLILAFVILLVGGAITPILHILIKDTPPADISIYVLYLMYLFNAVVGYFSAHKRSLLLAYQRNDIENRIKTIILLLMSALQIAVLVIFRNYYIYVVVNMIFTIIDCILVHMYANKLFPEINGKGNGIDTETKKEIVKNVSALSLHKVGSAVVFATDSILISSIFGITVLGAYSNYALIISGIGSLFTVLISALTGSVGNLIASESKEYVYERYSRLNWLFSVFSGFCTICLIVLFQPFITLWTGGGVYVLDIGTVIAMCVSFYLTKMRLCTLMVKECAGLMWQDRWKPIIEAVVNLVASIILAKFMGLAGIFVGTILSTIIAPIWVEPIVLYKHYFKTSVWQYWKKFLINTLVGFAVGIIAWFVCSLISGAGLVVFCIKLLACVVITAGLYALVYFKTPEFKYFSSLLKGIFKKKK